MPIRFRCPQCNQLLGIARRKAGSTVNCPNCATPVLVPDTDQMPQLPDAEAAAQAPAAPPEQPQALFERDDFDALLRATSGGAAEPRGHNSSVHAPTSRPAAPEPAPAPLPDPFRAEPVGSVRPARKGTGPPDGGVVLSPTRATVLTVVVILLLAIAFGGGLIVGRYFL
jgi:hypothetical protein